MTESGSGSEVEIDVEESTSTDRSAEPSVPDDAGRRGDSDREELRTDAERLAEELGRTEVRTTEDGYVEARVTGIETVDDTTVRLFVTLPTGRDLSFVLEKPVPWSEEFLLARIVTWVGYDAASIDHLVGERVLLDRTHSAEKVQGEVTWREGSRTSAYESVLSAFGLSVGDRDAPEWRLVDPLELDGEDKGRVGPRTKILIAGALTVLALGAIAATGATVPSLTVWFVLSVFAGLATMAFVLYTVLLLVGELGR